MWFRVELNADGSVVSCEHVESSGTENGGSVLYVEAQSPEEALRLAAAAYDVRMGKKRKQRALRILSGRCSACGKTNEDPFLLCAECRAKGRRNKSKAHAPGRQRPRTPTEKAERELEHQKKLAAKRSVLDALRMERARKSTLLEVLKAFDDQTPGQFRAWLGAELRHLGHEVNGTPNPELVTQRELCRRLSISRATIWRLSEEGLPVVKVGGASRYKPHDVIAWLESRQEVAAAE
jgi:predicted DNA-binding transcriptional regulator AlpA